MTGSVTRCVIYRCSRKQEMYLYVPWRDNEDELLDHLPPELHKLTGQLTRVMELELHADRKLARANVIDVTAALAEKGFYLQMPPNELLRRDDSILSNPSDTF
ncbi:MAG: YcgL domain-containing protein [Gammaproteobacteria bacterium]|nr:YcgL domain-containing protein [Gammaproteobacteria bacterium]